MKVTILGSGTDASNIPGIPNRNPPGYLVEWDNEKVLFDCSEGIRFRLEQVGVDYATLSHLAISHSHPDHYALPQFYQSVHNNLMWSGRSNIDQTLNVYSSKQIASQFRTLWQFYQPSHANGLAFSILNFVVMPDAGTVNIGAGKLTGFSVYHGFGKVDALAFRLEAPSYPHLSSPYIKGGEGGDTIIAYSGDTGLCDGLIKAARYADIFICECSAGVGEDNTTNYGHLNPRQAGEVAKEARAKKLILVHYPGLDSDEAMVEDCRRSGYNGEIVVGKDFMVFET